MSLLNFNLINYRMRNDKIYFRLPIGIGYEVNIRERRPIKQIIKGHPTSSFADPSRMKAFCRNQEIDVNQTFQDHHLMPGSIIHLNFSQVERKETDTQIAVFFQSNLLFFSVKYGCNVRELKKKIQRKLKFPVQEQILVFEGKKLGNEDQLILPQNSIISLIKTGEDIIQFDMQSSVNKFHSIKFENKKSQKKFMMKSLGYKSMKRSLKRFYQEYGPSEISEEDGYEVEQENIHQSQKSNSFLLEELGQEIILCDSQDEDEGIQPEQYKIEISEKVTDKNFIFTFNSKHSFQHLKTVISSLINQEENFVLVSERTRRVMTCKEQILEELKQITIPTFLIEK